MDLPWGAFGENFTTEGLLERDVRVGDRFEVGHRRAPGHRPAHAVLQAGRAVRPRRHGQALPGQRQHRLLPRGACAKAKSRPAIRSSSSARGGSRGDDRGRRRPPARAVARRRRVKARRKRLKRALLASAVVIAGAVLVVGTQPLAAFGLLERLTPNVVWRVETDQPLVALSFDDGPDPTHTPQVLDILRRVGRHRDLLPHRRAGGGASRPRPADQGRGARGRQSLHHEDAHVSAFRRGVPRATWSGRSARRRSPAPPKLFRPPGGVTRPRHLRLARERGYSCVLGSAYPYDGGASSRRVHPVADREEPRPRDHRHPP